MMSGGARAHHRALESRKRTSKSVGEYADGTQAVSAIQQQHPDLVFLDVQMPACDGFGVIQQLGPRAGAGRRVRHGVRRVRVEGL
jgi:two-component system LytT family response regulator